MDSNAPNPPEPPIFPRRKKTAAEILLEKIPLDKRPTNDMMYDRLTDQFLNNLPGNRKRPSSTKDKSTSPTQPGKVGLVPKLPPLPHLDQYRSMNNPENIRVQKRRQLLTKGYDMESMRQYSEPVFEAHRSQSATSSNYSYQATRRRLVLDPLDSDAYSLNSSRPSTSSSESSDTTMHLQEVSPKDICDYLQRAQSDTFLYVVFAYPPNDVRYDPFKLRIVPFNRIVDVNGYDHSSDFFTVSKKDGVVRLKQNSVNPENIKRVSQAEGPQAKRYASLQSLITPGDQSLEFIELDRWLEEYKNHRKLMKKRTFAKFPLAKAFHTWRQNVKRNNIEKTKQILSKDLYLLNKELRPALLSVRELCDQISSQNLCKIKDDTTYSLQHFMDIQMNSNDSTMSSLTDFRVSSLEKVKTACRAALLESGFTPDDQYLEMCPDTGQLLPPDERTVELDPPEKMTYTQQASKRRQCRRLTSFIRLCDYIIIDAMHSLCTNSLSNMKIRLKEQNSHAPTHEEITAWVSHYQSQTGVVHDGKASIEYESLSSDDENDEQPNVPTIQSDDDTIASSRCTIVAYNTDDELDKNRPTPLFETQICVDTSMVNYLVFEPSEETFLSKISKIIEKFEDTCKTVRPLVNDVQFEPFTKPLINRKFESKTCGEGPQLDTILEDDVTITDLKVEIETCISDCFDRCDSLANYLLFFYNFYRDNEDCDIKIFDTKDSVRFFREALQTYARQDAQIRSIHDTRKIGMLLCKNTTFKDTIGPSPVRMLTELREKLPEKFRFKLNNLMEELRTTKFKLDEKPTGTEEFVEHLTFLDQSVEKQPFLFQEAKTIQRYHALFKKYGVESPPEDIAVFESLTSTQNYVRDTVDRCLGERDQNIDKLVGHIDRDVQELNRELKDVKEQLQNPTLLDQTASRSEVKDTLNDLISQIDELIKQAHTYKSYQKQFKVETTRFEELEAVDAELRLKDLAWNVADEWKAISAEWDNQDFITLDPEELNLKLQQYTKHVMQLEKGLPPNNLVPQLRAMVESTRQEMSTITNLRNPCMEGRHWGLVEKLIERKLTVTNVKIEDGYEAPVTAAIDDEEAEQHSLTLKMLRDWEIMGTKKLEEDIEAVSGQASGEQALKQMLAKVDEGFKETELIVLNHKESKDVFILGGTDDVQMQLDDGRVAISTIASSRYVGPIKHKVDEWQRSLNLMSDTLDEWLICQRSWLYLESIFSAPDIQRQLPNESKMFSQVDKSWKDIMRKTERVRNALRACTQPGLLESFKLNNDFLDQIQKCLEQYLESKRVIFPRFYFLSNDELLEILAQTKNPLAVQPHLRKCFDAISSLTFGKNAATGAVTNDILAMNSPEGESVPLVKGLKARGNVEDWLCKVEEAMVVSLRKLTKASLLAYNEKPRHEWVKDHSGQVILTVSQTEWCKDVYSSLGQDRETVVAGTYNRKTSALAGFEQVNIQQLNALASIVRTKITSLLRMCIGALITIDVHARDIITSLVEQDVTSATDFEWLRQVRYFWDQEIDNSVVRCSDSRYVYGYEYLGASGRLVITPLTDRCYLCLMGALQLDLGGAPAGPAGTGKTETTKDLAKALAKQCIVFNCSEQMDYRMMGKFFSGLAQSGAWACFDEFNRIDIEVLSVIAQQLLTIRNAKASKLSRFEFEGREIKLEEACAVFITMNPGYAGRTELPDNLKALFRPMAMMVPDYGLIGEVILFSEGFENSRKLAKKMVQMYQLCSEQLSQQDHYDFGMRAVKSVLVMAGSLKRENPNVHEDITLIRALRDSNLPKFLKADAHLFRAILTDLFPSIVIPPNDYGVFLKTIKDTVQEFNLQFIPAQGQKVIQFFETLLVRHGVMLVGPTGGGKTTVMDILAKSLCKLKEGKHDRENPNFQAVSAVRLNPKAINMGELYGEEDPLTLEWADGLMAICVRKAAKAALTGNTAYHWIIADGPVDALWIENMNTVLDDNKTLCLVNSERIKLSNQTRMVFEVADLAVASPATVSRCGMVYIDEEDLGWKPYMRTWLSTLGDEDMGHISAIAINDQENKDIINDLFDMLCDDGIKWIAEEGTQLITTTPLGRIQSLCAMFESCFQNTNLDLSKQLITQVWLWCYIWIFGGCLVDTCWEKFDTFLRTQCEDLTDARLPSQNDVFSYSYNLKTKRWEPWTRLVQNFRYNPETPFFDMLVPTMDTVRFSAIMSTFLSIRYPVLFSGSTGVGKTVIAKNAISNEEFTTREGLTISPVFINFSAQSSSQRTQEMIELRLEKRRKTLLSAPPGKEVVFLIDDLNMPRPDTYGSQPPIEILRQIIDCGGIYDRPDMHWKQINGVTICAACGPPGGGRTTVPPRFQRRFATFCLPAPSEQVLKTIFSAILNGFLSEFPADVKSMSNGMVEAAIEIYRRMASELLPTPSKSHYVFNLRDLSKCIQGVLRVTPSEIRDPATMFRLFGHEAQRVFHDRLIDDQDKKFFLDILTDVSGRFLKINTSTEQLLEKPIIFCDFMKAGVEKDDRTYEDVTDIRDKVTDTLQDYLDDYNLTYNKNVKLVFFSDAILHISRIARILGQERGNALLVGVGGTGKQSLTRLAAHASACKCFQIELSRGYNYESFHEDLRKLYRMAGVDGNETVFLFTDTQIVVEEFLEDINNILNSGEVPNLFEKDELEDVLSAVRPFAKAAGVSESDRDAVWQFFISRVRTRLHLVLAMSPVGDAFRSRCRQFPSLINCCTIDWFVQWPKEALHSVSKSFFQVENDPQSPFAAIPAELLDVVTEMCVEIHASTEQMAERFFTQLKRRSYTTPTSYLELINLFGTMLTERRKMLKSQHERYSIGLQKLAETNELVETMQLELAELEPILKVKSKDTEKLMETLTVDQEEADKVRVVVEADEKVAKAKAEETQIIADDAQRDLDQALPLLEAANKALDSLDKNDISEIRVFSKPPDLVVLVMEAVCILMGQKPDWSSAKSMLGDSQFLNKLMTYNKDNIPMSTLKKLKKYIDNESFHPDKVERVSKACKSMCFWARALNTYAYVVREVEPKKRKLAKAKSELDEVLSKLKEKQDQLKEVEDKIATLQARYTESVNAKDKLMKQMALTAARLKRADKLTSALGDEGIRWKVKAEELDDQMNRSTGDALLSAAAIAYYGAFTAEYRLKLLNYWVLKANEIGLPASEGGSLEDLIGDKFVIRQWNSEGLPRDQLSTENALLVTKGRRWPLLIDPQDQANRWIRNREARNGLKVIKLTDKNFLRTLENAVRTGQPVLLEDIGETLDPALEPILLKQTFMSGGRMLIRLGDSDIDYDKNFRFYVTTKMANPHYLPELQIKVTLVNFTVTQTGLEDQILSEVVKLERPDLEEQRTTLITRINADKAQLDQIEQQILKMLFNSEGNILDNEALINALNDSKITSATVKSRLEEAEKTEIKITTAREKYRPVAARSSVLYFVVANMSLVDPMYQFSLKYYQDIFSQTVKNAAPSADLNVRLNTLSVECTAAIYRNVARGLFEKHKLTFSFLLCLEIQKLAGLVSQDEFNLLLAGIPNNPDKDYGTKPDMIQADEHWRYFTELSSIASESLPFHNFNEVCKTQHMFITLGDETVRLNARKNINYIEPSDDGYIDWNETLSGFQKLTLIRLFCPERLTTNLSVYVEESIGRAYVLPPPSSLPALYADMLNITPLVFILSPGSDPMVQFQKFASEKGYDNRYHVISLGQGQGKIAERLLEAGMRSGDWVFLQNCHLAKSWMPSMEGIIKGFTDTTVKRAFPIHADFRLYLSSMPTVNFPVSALQSAVKVTNEPPAGLRANLKRSLESIAPDFFEKHQIGLDWRRSIIGVCFFHAIVQERKRFGALGWNIPYEFNDSDRDCCFMNFQLWSKAGEIQWDALLYITGWVTYGGRVTDSWDQRLLNCIMKRFIGKPCLESDYTFSSDGIYRAPINTDTLDAIKDYIDNLPSEDSPDVFGMHPNAQLAAQKHEMASLVDTLVMVSPASSGGANASEQDMQVKEQLELIKQKLSKEIKSDHPEESLFVPDDQGRQSSLTTVLMQEIERFNKLLSVIHKTLSELNKAIAGLVVMSEEIEAVYVALLTNNVPKLWESAAYPSPKSLGSWIADLTGRVELFRRWLENGLPKSFRLSYFFFPQGFMTGNLQNYARQNMIAIDRLKFNFKVLSTTDWPDVLSPDFDEVEANLPHVETGVLVYGLFCDAFRWNLETGLMDVEHLKVANEPLPLMHMIPAEMFVPDVSDYQCPLYKTPSRAGVLSTTGHSTNFICPVNLPTDLETDNWIARGTALICQLPD